MNIMDHISKFYLLSCMNPFQKKSSLSFQKNISQARRILIITPFGDKPVFAKILVHSINKLFPDKICTFLSTHEANQDSDDTTYKWISLDRENLTLWHFIRSSANEQLRQTKLDLLIDLDPQFNLISAYLCRKSQASLRISFEKEGSERLSNFQFNTSATTPYEDQVKTVISVLKTFLK